MRSISWPLLAVVLVVAGLTFTILIVLLSSAFETDDETTTGNSSNLQELNETVVTAAKDADSVDTQSEVPSQLTQSLEIVSRTTVSDQRLKIGVAVNDSRIVNCRFELSQGSQSETIDSRVLLTQGSRGCTGLLPTINFKSGELQLTIWAFVANQAEPLDNPLKRSIEYEKTSN